MVRNVGHIFHLGQKVFFVNANLDMVPVIIRGIYHDEYQIVFCQTGCAKRVSASSLYASEAESYRYIRRMLKERELEEGR